MLSSPLLLAIIVPLWYMPTRLHSVETFRIWTMYSAFRIDLQNITESQIW